MIELKFQFFGVNECKYIKGHFFVARNFGQYSERIT